MNNPADKSPLPVKVLVRYLHVNSDCCDLPNEIYVECNGEVLFSSSWYGRAIEDEWNQLSLMMLGIHAGARACTVDVEHRHEPLYPRSVTRDEKY